jgi:hypothetical protein
MVRLPPKNPKIGRIAAEYLKTRRAPGVRSQCSGVLLVLRTVGRFSMWVRARKVALGVVLVAWMLAFTQRANAAFEVADTGWEGASELLTLARERLGEARVEPVARLDYSALTPKDGVLLLHPEVELDADQLSAFLAAGGRIAVLDDFGAGAAVLARYRVHRIQAPLRPAETLRDNPNLAIAVPAVQSVAGQEQNRHPIVARVDRLVTNHPTAFTHPSLTPVLTIPAVGEPDAALAVTGIIAGRGRLFAMGDPSAVMNLMLRYPGNRAFAAGLIDYLVENDSWGARSGKLYVLANRFGQAGRFARTQGVAGQISELTDSLKDTLSGFHDDGLPAGLVLGAAAVAGLLALGWALLYAVRAYRRLEPRYATATPALLQGGVPGRAAVLAAPTTDPALMVAELDSLFGEELAHRAGLPVSAAPEQALAALGERGARPSFLLRGRGLLLRGRNARNAILTRKPSGTRVGQVAELERQIVELLADLDDPGQNPESRNTDPRELPPTGQ